MACQFTAEELLALYADGERDFAGIELIQSEGVPHGASIDLEGAILREINLRGADLTRADLTRADLFGACLEDARLDYAIVRDANLCSANLCNCSLIGADLTGTKLRRINATNASFSGALITHIEYAILTQANFQDSSIGARNLCRFFNLIWHTTLPDGTIKGGPYRK